MAEKDNKSILEKMGASITIKDGYVKASVRNNLKPINYKLNFPSVGVTHFFLMMSSLVEGESILKNAAMEPEVISLAKMLNKMGAKIQGEDTDKLIIDGVRELKPTNFSVMPDRIEIATYLTATTMTGGEITVKAVNPNTIDKVLQKLELAGAKISKDKDSISLKMKK